MQLQYRANRVSWRCPPGREAHGISGRQTCFLWAGLCLAAFFLGCQPPERLAIIEGVSMAPHLYGVHWLLSCRECACQTALRGDLPLKHPVCPNCGAPNEPKNLSFHTGPNALVRPLQGQPRRWEVVAFAADAAGSSEPRMTVKRIVGLPNESLRISGGDLWVDGHRLIKSWAEQQDLAILLRDFTHLPFNAEGQPTSPWESSASPACWESDTRGIRTVAGASAGPLPPVVYHHWAGYHTGQPRFRPLPILDSQPFDPHEARSLSVVHDLMLTGRCDTPDADFEFGFQVFDETLSFEFSASRQRLLVKSSERILAETAFIPPSTGYRFGISTFDAAATVAIDGRQQLQVPLLLTPASDRERLARPIILTSLERPLELSQLRLFRDVYYFDQPARANADNQPRTFSVPSGAYLLLGDNPVDSIDSRHWKACGLAASRIMGKVIWQAPSSEK